MGKKKRNGRQDTTNSKVVLATTILNFVIALINLINKLTE